MWGEGLACCTPHELNRNQRLPWVSQGPAHSPCKRKTEKPRYTGQSVPEATSVLPLGQTESPLTSGGGTGGPGLQGLRPEEATRQASVANTARDLRQPERVRLRPSR